MQKWMVLACFSALIILLVSFTRPYDEAVNLRKIYSRPPAEWPAPNVDPGVQWQELGLLLPGPLDNPSDSLKDKIALGKALFFDTRLSASEKISCATCHQPELNWTDGKEKSVGHDGAVSKRNSPTIQNAWFYRRLFWDGRAKDLQDQAFAPIISESEMGSDMPDVMRKLRRINGYRELFQKAYGDEGIDPDRMTDAIALFEKTIRSGKSRFDEFLGGARKVLTDSELRGLHLFRTKARCMNCHHGPLFSDNNFHNSGFSGNEDGLYKVTHKDGDKGKFKTPSLRDVMRTGPWMHDGGFKDLSQVISLYNVPKFPPGTDSLIRNLGLKEREKKDLLAFLHSISAEPVFFSKPVLPE